MMMMRPSIHSKCRLSGSGRRKPLDDVRDLRVTINRCDICNDRLIDCPDDIEAQISRWEETNISLEWDNDKVGPKLLLCGYCHKEYQIPAYPLNT